MWVLSFCSVLLFVFGCALNRGRIVAPIETVQVGEAIFLLKYETEDAEAAKRIKLMLPQAVATAERWGRFSAPVLVTIHPTHQALEAVAGRPGYGWLRAWARYSRLDLQSPRTWTGIASDAAMAQLLAHELCHCLLYQSAATESTWPSLGVPLWFREGMACVTAGQRHRIGLDDIGRFYQEQDAVDDAPGRGDPLSESGPLYRSKSELVYGTAHEAFRFLLGRYGEERVRRIIADMSRSSGFSEAFQEAIGISVESFEDDFRRHVIQHGTAGPVCDPSPSLAGAGR